MGDKTVFGFWVYLLTDFVMFGALFATFLVLEPRGGIGEGFGLAVAQTAVMLAAAFMSGLAGCLKEKRKACLAVVGGLGVLFLGLQGLEFRALVLEGNSWEKSAFLSAYFTLLGTFWLHVFFGVLWTVFFLLLKEHEGSERRATCLRIFWQFLNLVWLFILAVVYLGSHL